MDSPVQFFFQVLGMKGVVNSCYDLLLFRKVSNCFTVSLFLGFAMETIVSSVGVINIYLLVREYIE